MISAEHLSKHYGSTQAVADLSFEVRPGVVTGFLGPNGAGKSTTMRMVMGLDRPSSGRVRVNGKEHSQLVAPLREVGALLEAKSAHPGRSARSHLLALAQTNGLGKKRVDEVLELVGLSEVAGRRVGKFSLGMNQRLGIATALLGDPPVLLFDEPINGLDPEGILWVRTFLKDLASQGRTVFISSHLMSEMALTATDLVVVGRGKLLAATTVDDFIASNTTTTYCVRSSDQAVLGEALERGGARVTRSGDSFEVTNCDDVTIGEAARAAGVALYELSMQRASLEEVFMEMTADSVEYHGISPLGVAGALRGAGQ